MRRLVRLIPRPTFFVLLVTLVVSGLFLVAHAQDAGPAAPAIQDPGSNPGGFFQQLYGFLTNKDWAPLIATAVFGLVYAIRRFFPSLSGKAVSWALNFGSTASMAFVAALGAGKALWPALLQAILSSALAGIAWEGLKDVKQAATAPAPASPPTPPGTASQR